MKPPKLLDIEAESLELVLNFVYTGRITLSGANIERVHAIADYFQLALLAGHCNEFLRGRICAANVLGIRRFAAAHNAQRTVVEADQFIQVVCCLFTFGGGEK
jgi:hypothetical protein